MAVVKNLSPKAELNHVKDYLGKFLSGAFQVGVSVGLTRNKEQDDPLLPLTDKDLFQKMFSKRLPTEPYKIFKHNVNTYYVYLPRFLSETMANLKTQFEVILKDDVLVIRPYTDTTVNITDLVEARAKDSVKPAVHVAANGNQFVKFSDLADGVKHFGKVLQGGAYKQTSSTKDASTDTMSLEYKPGGTPELKFPFGADPATGAGREGLGGLTPVLRLDNQGTVIKYGAVKDDPAITFNNKYEGNLKNKNLDGVAHSRAGEGKHIFAYKRNPGGSINPIREDIALMIIQDGVKAAPLDIDDIRNALFDQGFEFAVGLDGSDSTFLFEQTGKPKWHVRPDERSVINKNNTLRNAYAMTLEV